MTAMTAVAALALVAWLYLACARGGFWRGRENDRALYAELAARRSADDAGATPRAWPKVVAIVPARDEAELVGWTVDSLLAQRYPGDLLVIVVDDHSSDGTADVARRAAERLGAGARLSVVAAPPLAAGWTGKLWALSHGVARCDAMASPPAYLLLTDADIRYDEDAVAALVSSAVDNRWVLSSLMVALRCASLAERALIPAFVFFFQMLFPFAWVNRPRHRTAAAAGGCVLVDRATLAAAGGLASIRGALIDDCALAARIKPLGPIHLALAERVASLRPYDRLADVRRMVVRSAYAQLRFSPWLLLFVVAAMTVVFVAPVAAVLAGDGWARLGGAVAWLVMAGLFVPTLVRYRVPRWTAVALPAIALAYLAFTVESAVQHLRGRGGLWKGRVNRPAAGTSR